MGKKRSLPVPANMDYYRKTEVDKAVSEWKEKPRNPLPTPANMDYYRRSEVDKWRERESRKPSSLGNLLEKRLKDRARRLRP